MQLFASTPKCELLRPGASMASVPVDMLEANGVAAARDRLASGGIDAVLVDTSIAPADRSAFIADARGMKTPPFVFVMASNKAEAVSMSGTGADGAIVNPSNVEEATAIVENCIQL